MCSARLYVGNVVDQTTSTFTVLSLARVRQPIPRSLTGEYTGGAVVGPEAEERRA